MVQTVPMLWVAALVYVVGIPLFAPTVPILLMQCVPPGKRGQVRGAAPAPQGPCVFECAVCTPK
eukprot:8949138-Pyramimonas_sp.AAC.1